MKIEIVAANVLIGWKDRKSLYAAMWLGAKCSLWETHDLQICHNGQTKNYQSEMGVKILLLLSPYRPWWRQGAHGLFVQNSNLTQRDKTN